MRGEGKIKSKKRRVSSRRAATRRVKDSWAPSDRKQSQSTKDPTVVSCLCKAGKSCESFFPSFYYRLYIIVYFRQPIYFHNPLTYRFLDLWASRRRHRRRCIQRRADEPLFMSRRCLSLKTSKTETRGVYQSTIHIHSLALSICLSFCLSLSCLSCIFLGLFTWLLPMKAISTRSRVRNETLTTVTTHSVYYYQLFH